jgi:large subunit ribosomal protein L15
VRLEDLRPAPGAKHRRKIVGRGPGSGRGKTATKGSKGQQARSGGGTKAGFEGGQMPLYRRLPKRGFVPHGGKRVFAIVNLSDLDAFAAGSVVDPESLVQARLVRRARRGNVKILGEGDVAHALTVRAHAVSESARVKIEAKGGRVEVLAPRTATS